MLLWGRKELGYPRDQILREDIMSASQLVCTSEVYNYVDKVAKELYIIKRQIVHYSTIEISKALGANRSGSGTYRSPSSLDLSEV